MNQKPSKPLMTYREQSMMKSASSAMGSAMPSRAYAPPIEEDLGLLGPYPSVIGGQQMNMSGAGAEGIYDGQYSAGGSILDALLDADLPMDPPAKKKATPPPPPAGMKVRQGQQAQGGGEATKLFEKHPALAGYMFGVVLLYLLNEYA